MEVSGDEGGLLEWTTVSTPGEREEGSTKGMLAVVGKETIFTRWIYHFSLEVQMKSSRGIAERMSGLGAEIVGRPPHPTSAVQALLPKKRVNCELRLYFELSTTFILLAVLNKDNQPTAQSFPCTHQSSPATSMLRCYYSCLLPY